jgi:effector-binding domain-containing protein
VKRLVVALAVLISSCWPGAVSPVRAIQVPVAMPNRVGEIQATTLPAHTVLALPMQGSFKRQQEAIYKILDYTKARKLKSPTLFCIYHNRTAKVPIDSLKWEIAVEVPAGTQAEAPFVVRDVPEQLAAVVICTGSYAGTVDCYTPLYEWIDANGYVFTGPLEEHWLSDSSQTRADDCQTRIVVPIGVARADTL